MAASAFAWFQADFDAVPQTKRQWAILQLPPSTWRSALVGLNLDGAVAYNAFLPARNLAQMTAENWWIVPCVVVAVSVERQFDHTLPTMRHALIGFSIRPPLSGEPIRPDEQLPDAYVNLDYASELEPITNRFLQFAAATIKCTRWPSSVDEYNEMRSDTFTAPPPGTLSVDVLKTWHAPDYVPFSLMLGPLRVSAPSAGAACVDGVPNKLYTGVHAVQTVAEASHGFPSLAAVMRQGINELYAAGESGGVTDMPWKEAGELLALAAPSPPTEEYLTVQNLQLLIAMLNRRADALRAMLPQHDIRIVNAADDAALTAIADTMRERTAAVLVLLVFYTPNVDAMLGGIVVTAPKKRRVTCFMADSMWNKTSAQYGRNCQRVVDIANSLFIKKRRVEGVHDRSGFLFPSQRPCIMAVLAACFAHTGAKVPALRQHQRHWDLTYYPPEVYAVPLAMDVSSADEDLLYLFFGWLSAKT